MNKLWWVLIGAGVVAGVVYVKRKGGACCAACAGDVDHDDDDDDEDDGPGYGAAVLQRVSDGTTHIFRTVLDLGKTSPSAASSSPSPTSCSCSGGAS
jgi:hypothetical protein